MLREKTKRGNKEHESSTKVDTSTLLSFVYFRSVMACPSMARWYRFTGCSSQYLIVSTISPGSILWCTRAT